MTMDPSCHIPNGKVSAVNDLDVTAKYLNLMSPMLRDQPTENISGKVVEVRTGDEKDNQQVADFIPVHTDGLSMEMVHCNSRASSLVSTENKTYPDTFSLDLSLDNIQDNIDIASSIVPRAQETIEITENQVHVYPDLIFVGDSAVSDEPIDLNNIQLYLECSDDGETPVTTSHFDPGCEILSQTGTSLLKSDVRLKISFPVFPEDSERGFKCSLCKEYFILEDELRSHILQTHGQEICMCPFCSYNTKSKKFFETHLKTKHKQLLEQSTKLITCSNLTTHNDSVEVNTFPELNTSPASIQSQTGHVTAVDLLICDLHDVPLTSQQPEREAVPLGEDLHSASAGAVNLAGHIGDLHEISHSDGRSFTDHEAAPGLSLEQFTCQFCNFITKSFKLLTMHYNTMHDSNRPLYNCSKCSYVCKQKRSFLSHMDLHSGAYKFECEVCRKKIVSKSMYTRHRKNHSENRDYSCEAEDCRKAFKTKGALTDHIKKVHNNHTEKRSVEQIVCAVSEYKNDKATCTSTDRFANTKLKSNTDNMNIQISTCHGIIGDNAMPGAEQDIHFVKKAGIGSSKKRGITNRDKSQTEAFKCSYPKCNKAIRDNFNLRNHMCIHEGLKKLSCCVCEFVCVQKSSLNYHYKSKHAKFNNSLNTT